MDDANRPLYRELAAGPVRAGSTFRSGPESIYRLTREGFERKAELLASGSASDSAAGPPR